jgi:hypothetical protein
MQDFSTCVLDHLVHNSEEVRSIRASEEKKGKGTGLTRYASLALQILRLIVEVFW